MSLRKNRSPQDREAVLDGGSSARARTRSPGVARRPQSALGEGGQKKKAHTPAVAAPGSNGTSSASARYGKLAAAILSASGEPTPAAKGMRLLRGTLPSRHDMRHIAEDLLELFFPEAHRKRRVEGSLQEHLALALADLELRLEEALYLGLHRNCPPKTNDLCRRRARAMARKFLASLPALREALAEDTEAAFEADPAASGVDEIVACYPGLYAIAIYRSAHRLVNLGAEVVPRMLTEHAHSHTGIDIHPGAQIGKAFFIDHGTGIVIGETSNIGDRVRIYQGVTLGALSVRDRGHAGGSIGNKRHPTIEDDVIIYANATILGGKTVIGRGAVVGGNAWITYSVPPGIRVGVGT
jgi:serine O-acetyltransferase